MELQVSSGTFASASGPEKIYYKKIYPRKHGDDIIHLVILHDFCEFHGRYAELVNYFSKGHSGKVGLTLIDFKGHGLSSGTRSHVNDFSEYASDLKSFFEKNAHGFFVLGHGLGALVALDFIRQYENLSLKKIKGLILSNPFVGMNDNFFGKGAKILKSLPKKMWSKIRIPYHLRGGDLTHDFSQGEAYDDNPVINRFLTLSLLLESMKVSNEVIDISYYLRPPVLALVGVQDNLVRLKQVELFFRAMPQSKVEIKRYDMGHDLYNEIGREILFQDIANWLFEVPK